jgi:hypothetical protein
MRTYLIERRAPLAAPARAYIERTVFGRNWGARLRDFLDAADQERLRELCDPASPRAILDAPDYYCLYSITVFTAVTPA